MVKTNLKCAGASDPGRVRRNNEDAFHIDADRGIFLVVDGIGGQAAGEKAAAIAVERVRARLERQTGTGEQRVREAIAVANNEILRQARSNPEWDGMACVLTVALIENGSAVIGHVGDSRLYQIRGGQIRKITHDHSPVGEREDGGELTESEAMRHPRRNEIFRDVGSEEHAPDDPDFIEVQRIPFEADSALLLCSDGLSDLVPSAGIRSAVERNAGDPAAAVKALIETANSEGGKDNVTVIVVEGDAFRAPDRAVARPETRRYVYPALIGLALAIGLFAGGLAYHFFWEPKPTPPPARLAVGGGSQFQSIAAALAAARPGDTVEIPAGEYREQVRLKSGVNLIASGAVLRAAPLGDGPAVIAENVTGARITGFRILADEKTPIATGILLDRSDVEVDDIEIAGTGVGIEMRDSGAARILGNSIHDCLAEGALAVGGGSPRILRNVFLHNKGVAIAARGGATPLIENNVFDKATFELPPEISPDALRSRNIFLEPAKPARGGKKKQ
jgi:serine/threonine protein phosphatase PrpC